MKDPSSPKQRLESIMNAYSSMYEDIHHMKVDNYQTTGGDGGTNVHKKYNLKIIEDCAQAQGAKFKNRYVGSFGNTGCFSFYPTKILGGYGDGGFIGTVPGV